MTDKDWADMIVEITRLTEELAAADRELADARAKLVRAQLANQHLRTHVQMLVAATDEAPDPDYVGSVQ